ncbi:DUF998 domain-containing protein [Thermoactinospora rubra]|uniref:DUF998 domain-containing protein n=1 Tax=Thermoactinospora rubra TaxID=1088767 RepID=UPI000A10702E|nr:DUF998 domain-containing protein [Thermoactinospora rubra]
MTIASPLSLARLACLGLVLTAAPTMLGHVDADSRLTAFGHTISDYAVADLHGPVTAGMYLAAVASLALLAGLRRMRAPVTRAAAWLLASWSGFLLVAAIVPTDPLGVELTATGYVHRYASAAAFVSLLAACRLMSRSLRADARWRDLSAPVQGLTLAAAVSGLAMVATAYFGDRVLIGLAERAMAAFAVASLVLLALRALKLAARPAPRFALAV